MDIQDKPVEAKSGLGDNFTDKRGLRDLINTVHKAEGKQWARGNWTLKKPGFLASAR